MEGKGKEMGINLQREKISTQEMIGVMSVS